jgi:hypothetical protein
VDQQVHRAVAGSRLAKLVGHGQYFAIDDRSGDARPLQGKPLDDLLQ